MATLDLGTLVARIKAEGVEQAKNAFKGLSSTIGNASNSANSGAGGFKNLSSSFLSGIGNVNLFGTNLGSLTGALGSTEAMAGMLGGVMAGVVVAGFFAAIEVVKKLTAALVDFLKETVKVGIQFQATMSKVAAITGATDAEMATLTDGARKFGATTVFNASQAAEAMTYMGMAGWKTEQIMSGMPGVLDLAAASGEDLALVSDIVTDALTAFGETAEESGRLADILAAASTNSNTNVAMMGETFKYVAPVAGALNYSMEDTALAIGLMANSGIKASQAGTALRAMFSKLAAEPKRTAKAMEQYGISITDASGKIKPLNDLMVELRAKLGDVTEAEQAKAAAMLFGTEAMSGGLAIINATEADYNKLSTAINGSEGAAKKMATTMSDNIAGLQKSIASKFESIKLSIFNVIEPFISGALKMFDAYFAYTEKAFSAIGGIFGRLADTITPALDVTVGIIKATLDLIWPLIEPFVKMIEANLDNIMKGLQMLASVVMAVVTSIVEALKPLVDFINNTLMIVVDLMSGNWESALARIEVVAEQFADAVCALFLRVPNTIINVINAVTTKMNEYFGTNITQLDKFETHFADKAKTALSTAEKNADAMKKIQEDAQNELEGLDAAYDNYMDAKMKKWEEKVEGRYNLETMHGAKAYEKAKQREEEKLQMLIDSDKAAEERKLANRQAALQKQVQAEKKAQEEMKAAAQSNYEKQTSWLDKLANMWSNLFKGGKTNVTSDMNRHANGTINSRGGFALVGEFGPEIVKLNPGDSVNQLPSDALSGTDSKGIIDAVNGLSSKLDAINQTTRNITREQKINAYMGTVRG